MRPTEWAVLVCETCASFYEVEPYRRFKSKHCSLLCHQRAAAKSSARVLRAKLYGTGKSYVKLGGRHEHRVVAEKKLGRKLLPGEIVHHDDENKKNNSEGNLVVTNQSAHIKIHWAKMMARRKEVAGY